MSSGWLSIAAVGFAAIAASGIAGDDAAPARWPDAIEVFHCDFAASWDENYDGWPDGWMRRRGRGYPHYVHIQLDDEPADGGPTCLRVDLDGGGAGALSPPIKVSHLYSYVLEGLVKTDGLEFDEAFYSVVFLDADRKPIETFVSTKFRSTAGWRRVRLGPVAASSDRARWAQVGLHVEPTGREDLRGTARFADVWLGRLSRMTVRANHPFNFFLVDQPVEITCELSGFVEPRPVVTFRVEDALGRTLERTERPLDLEPATPAAPSDEPPREAADSRPTAEPEPAEPATRAGSAPPDAADVGQSDAGDVTADAGAASGAAGGSQTAVPPRQPAAEPPPRRASARWTPTLAGPGFYRLRVTLPGSRGPANEQQMELVVVEPQSAPPNSEFGWTLPRGEQPLGYAQLFALLGHSGIRRVKLPVWFDESRDPQAVEQLVGAVERLSAQGIEVVGLLSDPPASLRQRYGRRRQLDAADLFAPEAGVWYPSLEPVLARLAMRVRCWQLGGDEDTSFVHDPQIAARLGAIKKQFDRIGRDVRLGVGWNWLEALPPAPAAAWSFLALSADPPLTDGELGAYLGPTGGAANRWVVLRPLDARHYSSETRAVDLVRRMMAAKIDGAEAVFCPDPFDPRAGLMNEDGTPGELFMAWRAAALALGSARHVGSLQLPQGSENQVFARGDEAAMILWNSAPTEETLYLGGRIRQTDLWGHAIGAPQSGSEQTVLAGPAPTIVTGLSAPLARWHVSLRLEHDRLPSVFGRPHANRLAFENSFPQGAAGSASLVVPDGWKAEPRQFTFRLAHAETFDQPFEIILPYSARSGRHPVRVDFEIQADRPYRFSVYRHIDVGLGDVYVKLDTRLTEDGELEVEQRLVNEAAEPVSFRCQLYAPDRQRQRTDVVNLGPGCDVRTYRLPGGAELIGKTLWLQAEEIGGGRVLNYRFTAEKK